MKTTFERSIEYQVLLRLNRIRSNVILRRELRDLGSYSQTSRVLKKLVAQKILVKIGFGIYAKSYSSLYADIPLVKGGIDSAINTALKKLGVDFEVGSRVKEYAAGLTTQIPAKNIIRLKSRCRRQLGYGKVQLIAERGINAR